MPIERINPDGMYKPNKNLKIYENVKREGLSVIIMESMAIGIPIITTISRYD